MLQGSFPKRLHDAQLLGTQNKPSAKHLLSTDKVTWDGGASRHWDSSPVERAPYAKRDKLWRFKATFLRTQSTQHTHARVWGPASALTLGEVWTWPQCGAEPFPGQTWARERGGSTAPQLSPPSNPSSLGLFLHPCRSAASVCQKRAIAALLFQPRVQSCPTVKGKKTNKHKWSAQGVSTGVTAQKLEWPPGNGGPYC